MQGHQCQTQYEDLTNLCFWIIIILPILNWNFLQKFVFLKAWSLTPYLYHWFFWKANLLLNLFKLIFKTRSIPGFLLNSFENYGQKWSRGPSLTMVNYDVFAIFKLETISILSKKFFFYHLCFKSFQFFLKLRYIDFLCCIPMKKKGISTKITLL